MPLADTPVALCFKWRRTPPRRYNCWTEADREEGKVRWLTGRRLSQNKWFFDTSMKALIYLRRIKWCCSSSGPLQPYRTVEMVMSLMSKDCKRFLVLRSRLRDDDKWAGRFSQMRKIGRCGEFFENTITQSVPTGAGGMAQEQIGLRTET